MRRLLALLGTRHGCVVGRDSTTVTCEDCHISPTPLELVLTDEPLERGQAGASAAREHECRRDRREQRTHERHPRVGGLLLLLRDAPQHETAWQRGAAGERAVGESLEKRVSNGTVVLLHDRRMPRSRANIDHLAIAPSGVYVIDAKDYTGKVRIERPWLGTPKLLVNGRDRTKIVDGLDRQVAAVRDAIDDPAIPLHGVFCFTKADIPIVFKRRSAATRCSTARHSPSASTPTAHSTRPRSTRSPVGSPPRCRWHRTPRTSPKAGTRRARRGLPYSGGRIQSR